MNVAEVLHCQARTRGSQPAIIEPGRSITFDELDRRAAAAAEDLAQAGIRPGMRALVFSGMSVDLYVVLVALFRLRAAAVFVDPSSGRDQIAACAAALRPDAFIGSPRAHLLRLAVPAIRGMAVHAVIGGRLPFVRQVGHRPSATPAPVESCEEQTPALITFTSGSTGRPKAAVRTHGFLLAQHRALSESLALTAGDVDLTTLPMFVFANLASGVTSIIPDADLRAPGAVDADRVLDQIARLAPTRVVASPALLDRLVQGAERSGRTLDSFRQIFTGGAPVFPPLLAALARLAPAAAITAVYGSTEAEPIATLDWRNVADADRAAMRNGAGLLAGFPEPSIDLRVVTDRWGTPAGPWTTRELDAGTMSAGHAGEIIVSGEHVLRGYVDGVGDEETKIAVGDRIWHRTGDAGYVDERGRLWLLGRCAARIARDGGVLYPFAVECAVCDVPGIRRSAFVEHNGRRILVVEPAMDAPSDLRTLVMERLSRSDQCDQCDHCAMISGISAIIATIPVDGRHNAKVDYVALRHLLGGPEVD